MKTTLLMLTRDRIEYAKFIHGTLSLTKLVYYKCSTNVLQNNFTYFTHLWFIYIYIYICVCVCVCVCVRACTL